MNRFHASAPKRSGILANILIKAEEPNPDVWQAVWAALVEHSLVVFPGQSLDPVTMETFGENFGPVLEPTWVTNANFAPENQKLPARPDALSPRMQAYLDGLVAVHDKALYVSEALVERSVGLPPGESDATLRFLHEHCAQPQFGYRHAWTPGDLVIWDNRSTNHTAVQDFDTQEIREGYLASGYFTADLDK